MDEERLRRLRVVVTALDSTSDRGADDERGGVLPSRAVAELPQLVHDLIEGGEDEVAELDLGHRLEAVHGHPDGGADDPALRERRIDDAGLAEFLVEPGGGAEDAAELADVLAEEDDARIALHLDPECVVDGLDDVPLGHGYEPVRSCSTQRWMKNSPAL